MRLFSSVYIKTIFLRFLRLLSVVPALIPVVGLFFGLGCIFAAIILKSWRVFFLGLLGILTTVLLFAFLIYSSRDSEQMFFIERDAACLINYIGEHGKVSETMVEKTNCIRNFDVWGNPLKYTLLPDETFDLRSAGRDGKFYTDDDVFIANWMDFQKCILLQMKEMIQYYQHSHPARALPPYLFVNMFSGAIVLLFDFFGNRIVYVPHKDGSFELTSVGADGVLGTQDDIFPEKVGRCAEIDSDEIGKITFKKYIRIK